MITIASKARDNAIALEFKKDGLQQRQNGDWVVRFTIQASDMDQRLTKAAMGTRFVAALVEVDENEEPKPEIPDPPKKKKMDWRELQPAAQSAIRCADPIFSAFLREEYNCQVITTEDAAEAVREICGVGSRSDLSVNHKARVLWHQLDEQFLAWKHIDA